MNLRVNISTFSNFHETAHLSTTQGPPTPIPFSNHLAKTLRNIASTGKNTPSLRKEEVEESILPCFDLPLIIDRSHSSPSSRRGNVAFRKFRDLIVSKTPLSDGCDQVFWSVKRHCQEEKRQSNHQRNIYNTCS